MSLMINVVLTITAWRRRKQEHFISAVNCDEIWIKSEHHFVLSAFTVLFCSWAHEWAVKNCKADFISSRFCGVLGKVFNQQ